MVAFTPWVSMLKNRSSSTYCCRSLAVAFTKILPQCKSRCSKLQVLVKCEMNSASFSLFSTLRTTNLFCSGERKTHLKENTFCLEQILEHKVLKVGACILQDKGAEELLSIEGVGAVVFGLLPLCPRIPLFDQRLRVHPLTNGNATRRTNI